jgi:hypothetical protein
MPKGARAIRGLRFPEPPPPGTSFMLEDGQTYTLASAEPYTRADGRPSHVLRWTTTCSATGKAFAVVTGLSFSPARLRRYHPEPSGEVPA